MNDGKEVKRWFGTEEDHGHFIPIEKVEDWHRKHWLKSVEVMPVEDHDRIVAELQKDLDTIRNYESSTLGKAHATIAELRAELFAVNHKLTKHRAANKILEAAIARQAKVIEKLKATIKDCLELGVSALNRGNWKEGEPLLRKSWVTLQELAAIEKEGAKDE